MVNKMSRLDRVYLAYDFLVAMEKSGKSFSINELADFVGWEVKSCTTYVSKRWFQYVSKKEAGYTSTGVSSLSREEFCNLHSQKLRNVKDYSEKGQQLQKAKEFALLAVTVYNNPLITLKTHGFIINIIIAFTSLFHAIFNKNGIDYFSKDNSGNNIIIEGDNKTWELNECCEQYWKGVHTPEKSNLKFLIGLRNKIEHRNLPELDLLVAGYCQSALSNFENILVDEFGDEHALFANLAIAMQLTRMATEDQARAMKNFQKENYRVVKEYMETFNTDLNNEEILESQKYRLRVFLIPKIGNASSSSDLAIEFVNAKDLDDDELRNYNQAIALIKGVESQYKLRPGKVVERVKKHVDYFNMAAHTSCWKEYKARPSGIKKKFKGKYAAYVEGFDGYLYSNDWVDFLIKELTKS